MRVGKTNFEGFEEGVLIVKVRDDHFCALGS
jgi:hypothetical protein